MTYFRWRRRTHLSWVRQVRTFWNLTFQIDWNSTLLDKIKYYSSKVMTYMLFGKVTVTQRRKWYKTFEPGKYRGLKILDIFLTFWEKIRKNFLTFSWHFMKRSEFPDISPIFSNFLTIPDFSDIPDKVDTLNLLKRIQKRFRNLF